MLLHHAVRINYIYIMETKEKKIYKKLEPLDPNKTYKCSKCGAYLPLKMFHVFANGTRRRQVCKRCLGEECYKDERFANFTSRDIILELRARGYIGKLQLRKVITEDVDI